MTRTDDGNGRTGPDDAAGTSAPVVVVTGASRGIGAHLATAFERHGYVVERSSRSGDGEGVTALDVTDATAVAAYAVDVLARRGRVDVLVNNAGVIDAEVALWESDPEDWWRTVEVNVRGPYLMSRSFVPAMMQGGSGRVINLNSGAGTRAGEVASAYNVGKTALARITGSIHLAGGAAGVLAFDLAPGVVRTDMTESMVAHEGRTEWTSPEEVCELALALASGELDAWSGRMVRAGADTPASLTAQRHRATGSARTVGLIPWGEGDPLA